MTIAAVAAFVVFVVLLAIVLAAGRGATFLDGSITPSVSAWVDADEARWSFFAVVTHLGEMAYLSPVYLLLTLWCLLRRRPFVAAWVGTCGVTYSMLSTIVKTIVDRPRPTGADPILTFQETSFPSGHSGNAMTIATVLVAVFAMSLRAWQRVVVFVLAAAIPVLVGTSRMALGVHYPTDVLAGFALSLAWTTLLAAVIGSVARRPRWSRPAQAVPAQTG